MSSLLAFLLLNVSFLLAEDLVCNSTSSDCTISCDDYLECANNNEYTCPNDKICDLYCTGASSCSSSSFLNNFNTVICNSPSLNPSNSSCESLTVNKAYNITCNTPYACQNSKIYSQNTFCVGKNACQLSVIVPTIYTNYTDPHTITCGERS